MHELFEHTADLGLRATAPTLDSLFAEMAACLACAMVEEPAVVQPVVDVKIEIAGTNRDFLLFDWLKSLLMQFDEEHLLFASFEVQVNDTGLTAIARGELYDPARHVLAHEVKAITYHELKVEPTTAGWIAELIVDI